MVTQLFIWCLLHSPVSTVKGKEMADKSTLIETTFLNGDQQKIHPQQHQQQQSTQSGLSKGSSQMPGGGPRKSVPSSSGTKSPTVTKRAVPAFQNPVSSTPSAVVPVGPEVPYSSKSNSSPASSPAKTTLNNQPGLSNRHTNANTGNAVASRGTTGATNTYVAKTQVDNNQNRASGPPATPSAGPVPAAGNSNINTSDKDAFPTPGFVKNVPMTCKPFSGATDHSSNKEVSMMSLSLFSFLWFFFRIVYEL